MVLCKLSQIHRQIHAQFFRYLLFYMKHCSMALFEASSECPWPNPDLRCESDFVSQNGKAEHHI